MRVGRANGQAWLRLSEAASELGVSHNTLRRWSDAGKLTCYRSAGGHRRYRRTDVETLLRSETSANPNAQGQPRLVPGVRMDAELRAAVLALARVAAESIRVSTCRVSLGEADDEVVVLVARGRSGGLPEEERGPETPLATVREVLRTGRRLVVTDVGCTNLLGPDDAAALRRQHDMAILAVPITTGTRTIGALELVASQAPRVFSGSDVTFAEFMARHVARLLAEDQTTPAPSQLHVVHSAGGTPQNPQTLPQVSDVLMQLVGRIRHEFDVMGCEVLRWDRPTDTLEIVAAAASDGVAAAARGTRLAVPEQGPIARALSSAEIVATTDLATACSDQPHVADYRNAGAQSLSVVPVCLGNEVVGLLATYGRGAARPLGSGEVALMSAVAAIAALAFSGQHEPEVLASHITQVHDVITANAMHSAGIDAESLVLSTLRVLRQHFDACTLYRVEAETASPFPLGDTGGNPLDEGAAWIVSDFPPARRALAERAPVVVALNSAEPGVAARCLATRRLQNAVLAPVVFGDRPIGVLELGSAAAEPSTASRIIQVAADLLATVLGSTDVIAQLRRRSRNLELLVEAGLEDTARLSSDEILHAVAERLSDLTNTPIVDILALEGDAVRGLVSYDTGHFDAEWEGVVMPLRRYPCSRRAVETGEIVIASSLHDPVLEGDARSSLEKWGYQSQLCMPLVSHGHVLGLVELSDYRPRDFAEDLDLIRGLGQTAAHALENAALFEQVDRRNQILGELVELGTLASRTRDLEELANAVAERVLAAVDAADCDIYRMTNGQLRCIASHDRSGRDDSVLSGVFDMDRYPTAIRAIESHRVLVISGPDDPQLGDEERQRYRDYGFASEVCLPLIVNDELYGVLDVYDTRPRDFSEYLGLLKSAAHTLAGAFESALLVEQLERRSTVLRDIVELGAVASQAHDLETVLTALAERLRDTMDVADCDIFTLRDATLRCLVSADRKGLDTSVVGRVLNIDRFPATAMAVRTGQVMAVASLDDPRLTDEERADMAEYGFQSELCIPLVASDMVIGLIDVFDTRPRDYGEYLDLLRSVGQTAAGAIENAMLLDKLERRNAALAELVELGRKVSNAGGLRELVRAVSPRIAELMEADGCRFSILRGEMLHCLLAYDHGVFADSPVDHPLALDLFPSTKAAAAARTALVIEGPDDPRLSAYERKLYRDSGRQSEICVPLVLEDRVVGLLDVYDHRPRDYADYSDFLLRVGQMMAGAIENALLMERLEESNQTLALLVESGIEFGATLDRDEVLRSVARRLCAAASAPNCDIYTIRGNSLLCVACMDHGEPDPGFVGTVYRIEQLGLFRLAIEGRHPVYAEDVASDPRVSELERREGQAWSRGAMLSLPLISRGEVIGVARIHDDQTRPFERVDLLHSLAQVAAGALANATLFDELDRGAERMALVSDVSFELSSSLGFHEVLESTAKRLAAVAGAPLCDIYTLRGGAVLESVVSIDEGEVDTDWLGRTFPLCDWDAMRAAVETREPVVIASRDDPRLSAREVALMEEFRESGSLMVPLISRENVIGVLELTHRESPHVYSPDETATIVAICRFAALAIDNAELYERNKGMHLNNLKALSSALNAKDYYTLGHAARVAAYMVLLGEELGWPGKLLREVEEAAYLHDIGKINVPDGVLLKPSGLNAHEWELMRQHPIFSAEIIRPLFDDALVQGVRHHHERWAGGGYPDGLVGEAIPAIARAMCVADSYDAMSFRRPYRHGLTGEECLDELERCSGVQFDPKMVRAFRRVLARIAQGRRRAAAVATRAAASLTAEECLALREHRDRRRPEYASVSRKLREAHESDVRTRYVNAYARDGRSTIVLSDSQGDAPDSDAADLDATDLRSADYHAADSPHLGDEVVADDELAAVLAGHSLPANVLCVDQWGVWINGVAPVLDTDGSVAAVVSANIPATEGATEVEGLRSNVAQTFASMLHDSTVRSGRTELEAITDSLTGLYNHRYFHERLSEEIERCQEHGGSLALLLCDLDNFRAFNEVHGHGSGDEALRAVARAFEEAIRHGDLLARYGGEEFAAILIDTAEADAVDVAERMRASVKTALLGTAGDTLSVSIGVAVCPRDATFKDELVDKADWAMYVAKRRGGDLVMTFGAEHGGDTPEPTAAVRPNYVAVTGELIAAQEVLRRRRRSSLAQIALGVARETGVASSDVHAVIAAADDGGDSPAATIVALTQTYLSLVTERPYRARTSEAEALDELLRSPALAGEPELARAFVRVLAG